jgi:hypothetical protein
LREPVVVLPSAPGERALAEPVAALARLAAESEVWVLPSNESELVALDAAVHELPTTLSSSIRTPGTAHDGRVRPCALTDKAGLDGLLGPSPLSFSRRLATWVWRPGDELPAGVTYPLVLKPASKDKHDSFTAVYPAKLVVVASRAELYAIVDALPEACRGRTFVLQELGAGRAVSWCGWSTHGETGGHGIHAEIKTPLGQIGGTTTLARIEPSDERLSRAAAEICSRIDLDGVFEIEFLLDDTGALTFFCEINPRPWLQVALVLESAPNPFVEYFARNGFTRTSPRIYSAAEEPATWGSAAWYLRRTPADQSLSLRMLLRTLRHDVVFTEAFTLGEQLAYLGKLVPPLLGRGRGSS